MRRRTPPVSAAVLCIFQLPRRSFTGSTRRSSAATPGSVLPSRNSSVAPPPVETYVTFDAKPSMCAAAAASPPPTTLTAPAAVAARDRLADDLRAAAVGGALVNAHRSVEHDRLRRFDGARVGARRRRADVEDHLVADAVDRHDVRASSASNDGATTASAGQLERRRCAPWRVARIRRAGSRSSSRSDVPTSTPARRAACSPFRRRCRTRRRSALSRSKHADLVFDLRAADRADERFGGMLDESRERGELGLHQQSGRARQQMRDRLRSTRARGARSRRRRST